MPHTNDSPRFGRIAALSATVVGLLLMTGSVFADSIGLSGGGDGFGWKQLIAAVAGLVTALLGLAWLIFPPSSRTGA